MKFSFGGSQILAFSFRFNPRGKYLTSSVSSFLFLFSVFSIVVIVCLYCLLLSTMRHSMFDDRLFCIQKFGSMINKVLFSRAIL
jgi:hypothetical protein